MQIVQSPSLGGGGLTPEKKLQTEVCHVPVKYLIYVHLEESTYLLLVLPAKQYPERARAFSDYIMLL